MKRKAKSGGSHFVRALALITLLAVMSGWASACQYERIRTGGQATQDAILTSVVETIRAQYAQAPYTPIPPTPSPDALLPFIIAITEIPQTILPPLATMLPPLLTELAGNETVAPLFELPVTGASFTPSPFPPAATVSPAGTPLPLPATATPAPSVTQVPPAFTASSTATPVPATGTPSPAPTRLLATTSPSATATLPPSPFPAGLTVTFSGLRNCGLPLAFFQVANPPGPAYESVQVQVQDRAANREVLGMAVSNFPFLASAESCPPGIETLLPASTAYLSSPLVATGRSGNAARAIFLLCTQDGITGDCREEIVEFVIP